MQVSSGGQLRRGKEFIYLFESIIRKLWRYTGSTKGFALCDAFQKITTGEKSHLGSESSNYRTGAWETPLQ